MHTFLIRRVCLGAHSFPCFFPGAVLISTNWVAYNSRPVPCHGSEDQKSEITGSAGLVPFGDSEGESVHASPLTFGGCWQCLVFPSL